MKTFLKKYRLHIISGSLALFLVSIYIGFFINSKHSVDEAKAEIQKNIVLSEYITDNLKEPGSNAMFKGIDGLQQIEMTLEKSGYCAFNYRGRQYCKNFIITIKVLSDNGVAREALLESSDDVVIKKMVRNTKDSSRWDVYTGDEVFLMSVRNAEQVAIRQLHQGLYFAMKETPEELALLRKAEWAKAAEKLAVKPAEPVPPTN